MKIFQWTVRTVLFLLVLSFSLRNTQNVSLELVPGYAIEQPLIVLMLLTFIVGVVVAWLMLLPSWLKARKLISAQAAKELPAKSSSNEQSPASLMTSSPTAVPDTEHGI